MTGALGYHFNLLKYSKQSNNLVRLAVDHLHHHLVYPANHVLRIALQSCLHARIVEQLPDYQTRLFWIILPELVQLHNQLVPLVVLKCDVSQLSSRLARLNYTIRTFACSSMRDFMKAICLMALEMGLMTSAGPSMDLLETTTLSTYGCS